MYNKWCCPKNTNSVYDKTSDVVATALRRATISSEYAFSVFLCSAALSFSSAISLLLFPRSRNNAMKKTPKISHGLIGTVIANAPATALMTKFVAIARMSANASCLSQTVYNCDKTKYINAM